MKILVTGATGVFGKLIIPKLLKSGYTVIATSRDSTKARQLTFFDKINYLPYDISQKPDINLYDYFGKPDSMIHLAWSKLDNYNDEEHISVILESHKAFLFNLISNGLKDFNGIGTCYEYGLKEGELEEELTVNPLLPYAVAKNKLNLYVESLKKEYSLSVKWMRLFYVFGEIYGRKNLYSSLMDAIGNKEESFNMSGGDQVRDFLSPDEMAGLIIKVSLQSRIQGTINCCSGIPVRLKYFIKDFLARNNYMINLNLGSFPYLDYESMESWGSVKKLNSILQSNLLAKP